MHSRRSSFVVVAVCLAMFVPIGSVARAQDAASPVASPVAQITPGTRVQFVDPWHPGATMQGQVTRRWADSVSIHADGELSPVDFRLADLHSLSVSDGRSVSSDNVGRGALYGALSGAVIGGVLLSFMHHEESNKHPKGTGLEVGIATAFGAVAGAIGGALHAPERWHAVSPR